MPGYVPRPGFPIAPVLVTAALLATGPRSALPAPSDGPAEAEAAAHGGTEGAGLDLDLLLSLPAERLASALEVGVIATGALIDLVACPGGALLIETRAVSRLEPSGRTAWRLDFPYGLAARAAPSSGAWLAVSTSRLVTPGQREIVDMVVSAADGSQRILDTDRHPWQGRQATRSLLAWEPLPFHPDEDGGEGGDGSTRRPGDPARTAPPGGDGPRLGYRGRNAEDLFLEEGVLVLRTTRSRRKGRSWWSLRHYPVPEGVGVELAHGSPAPGSGSPPRIGQSGQGEAMVAVIADGTTWRLDPLAGTLTVGGPPPAQAATGVPLGEVHALEPGGERGGIQLVHPGGRRMLALAGTRIETVVRVPGTGVLLALGGDTKHGLLADEVRRTLFRLDLDRLRARLEDLAAAEALREERRRLLEAADQLGTLDPKKLGTELARLLASLASSRLAPAEIERIEALARATAARRIAPTGWISKAIEWLGPSPRHEAAATLLRLDLEARPKALAADLDRVLAVSDPSRSDPSLRRLVFEALLATDRPEQAAVWLDLPATDPAHLAGLAVRCGDRNLNAAAPAKAAAAYRLALDLKPDSDVSARKLARALLDSGQGAAALAVVEPLARADATGEPGGLRSLWFEAARAAGRHDLSRRILDGLRLDQPLDPRYLEWDADLLVVEGKAGEALPKLKALLRLEPGSKRLADKLAALQARLAPAR